jgi:hypothetical protein
MAEERVWTGGCACGGVRYEAGSRPEPVSFCHCGQCRRQHGHVGAYSRVARDGFRIVGDETLSWYQSSENARRGFCSRCGSSLFWDGKGLYYMDVTAGSLDEPTGVRANRHIYTDFKGDYYDIGEDGLKRLTSTQADPEAPT